MFGVTLLFFKVQTSIANQLLTKCLESKVQLYVFIEAFSPFSSLVHSQSSSFSLSAMRRLPRLSESSGYAHNCVRAQVGQ